jgi:DNA-binding response OmpR family regulator
VPDLEGDAGIAAGAVTRITKPFELSQLIAEIQRYWSQQRGLATERLPTPLIAIANLDDLILQIVRQRMADPAFGVAEWSDAAHLSNRQLRRKRTDRTGLSPIVWL